jgi:hypothetical protein
MCVVTDDDGGGGPLRRWNMFVQIIEGRVGDPDRLRRQLDIWAEELRPGATGFLGSTGGVTDDGQGILLARFDSIAAARANEQRPEQGRWWAETEACFEGDVSFTDSDDVELLLGGGSDDARFVQVMKDQGVDRDRMRALDRAFDGEVAASFRPDLLGSVRVWAGSDGYVEVAYFTSEADAREGERKQPPPELAEMMGDFEAMMADVEFMDIRDPWLH